MQQQTVEPFLSYSCLPVLSILSSLFQHGPILQADWNILLSHINLLICDVFFHSHYLKSFCVSPSAICHFILTSTPIHTLPHLNIQTHTQIHTQYTQCTKSAPPTHRYTPHHTHKPSPTHKPTPDTHKYIHSHTYPHLQMPTMHRQKHTYYTHTNTHTHTHPTPLFPQIQHTTHIHKPTYLYPLTSTHTYKHSHNHIHTPAHT